MIKCLLTELGRAGPPSHSVNKYILLLNARVTNQGGRARSEYKRRHFVLTTHCTTLQIEFRATTDPEFQDGKGTVLDTARCICSDGYHTSTKLY